MRASNMEGTMDARLMLLAAGALSFATVASAEPANPPVPSSTPAAKDRPVVLAAVEVPAATPVAPGDPAAAPAVPPRKPRTARVTTCRCAETPNP
jgi:hypothetical protein